LCVRPHCYALAMACGALTAGVLGLHECDNRYAPARVIEPASRALLMSSSVAIVHLRG
jgi:hypothetical protein